MQQVKAAFQAYTQALKDGARRVQGGPDAATKERLGGFSVIDVANLDEALKCAEQCPSA